ncbi:hypothetical protein FDUTEX481_07533 [Tolypothrix sp. PCC 7601]|nr:hypothetical protein FDUTEX481_07533 [Tolypothrix sp. PCC 7601]
MTLLFNKVAQMQNLRSSPNPFSQYWEKGGKFQSPMHGRGI